MFISKRILIVAISVVGIFLVYYLVAGLLQFTSKNRIVPLGISPAKLLSTLGVKNEKVSCASFFGTSQEPLCTFDHSAVNKDTIQSIVNSGEKGLLVRMTSVDSPIGRLYIVHACNYLGPGNIFYNTNGEWWGYDAGCLKGEENICTWLSSQDSSSTSVYISPGCAEAEIEEFRIDDTSTQ